MDFDYTLEPGKTIEKREFENDINEPKISVIMPYYNDKLYIEQTINSLLNQTFPLFEVIIVDDGSKDEKSVKKLDEIEKLDNRIKVFHKKNDGASVARDYATTKISKSSKYLVFLDSDDLLEKTYLECAYWTLETNKNASWCYSDSIGFEGEEYTWNKWFDSERMKKENTLVITAMIRKEDFFEVNGFELKEKNMFEDWNLWLKLIAKKKYPVRMNFYGAWYRRKPNSELTRARENKQRAMEVINETNKKITARVKAIQYPLFDFDYDLIEDYNKNIEQIKYKNDEKKNILIIIPWMVMGGADKFNIDLIKGLDKEKYNVIVICTEPAINVYRSQYEKCATSIYDLTTFLSQKDWISFINYIIIKNNIDLIINTNSELGYSMLPYIKAKYSNIPIIDYIHMEEWYERNGGYSRDSSSVASVIDKTLTCNANSEKILVNYFGRKQEETKTVYIGVDEKKFDPSKYNKEEEREKFGIKKKYVIGFICRISEQKRPFLLLEIMKSLKKKRDDFEFLIAGEGNMLSDLKRKVSNAGLDENVNFIGSINETQRFYIACDATLNCSIKEGVALTSYESLAMNVPVVTSKVGGQGELVNEDVGFVIPCMQDEEDIYDFNYSDEEIDSYVTALNKILDNLNEYKKHCRERILNGFTIDQMKQNMNKIIKEEIENPNQEKIENGKALSNVTDICKELVTEKLMNIEEKYKWECIQYNKYYGFKESSIKFQIFKEKMWKHRWYRAFIRILQKIGIIKVIKNHIPKQ